MRTLMNRAALALLLTPLVAWLPTPAAAQPTSRTAISVGAGLHPLGSALPLVQVERSLSDRLSAGLRLIGLEYTYEDGAYTEWGDGRGVELLLNYHFRGGAADGPYVSGGLGHFSVDWDWREPVSRGVRTGFGRTRGAQLSATVGWRRALGAQLFVDPALTVGHFFGTGKDSTGSRESELGSYVAASIKLGWRF